MSTANQPATAATMANPNPRVTCPTCGNEVGTRRGGRMRSHVRKVADVGIDGEPEYVLCSGSGWPSVTDSAPATAACRCDGRYDGCEHGRRCPNGGGSSHSPYFCTDCDPRRRAHITANLNGIMEAFRG